MDIKVFLRDLNGKRYCLSFQNESDFNEFDWSDYDVDNYEILMVTWGEHCIYNSLSHKRLYFEDLIGFFA